MKATIAAKITEILKSLQQSGELADFSLPEVRVDYPKDGQFGEYTSNIALALAKLAGKGPMEIAELLRGKLDGREFEKVEVAKPGYLNFYLAQAALAKNLGEILEKGQAYGTSAMGQGMKVNNEFISANPTGPLHLGNGRGGFYADVVAKVLRKTGHEVTNEYYVNDAGEQVSKLGHSVLKDEEAVYGGEYIEELHKQLGEKGGSVEEIGQEAASLILTTIIQPTVEEKMHIHFDTWTSEREVIESGLVERAIGILKGKGVTYEAEGALWFRTTDFGDDKDRVLVKSDGTKTYFASDCGHILGYIENGVEMILETFGADHHGYTKRFEIVAKNLGFEGRIHFTLMQLVKLMKDGEEVRMSKRAGNVVAIDELIEIVGHDVARFFFLLYAPETHMTFDLGLAQERSQKNPVFYVQYAHARLASILEKAEKENLDGKKADLSLLTHEKERELMRELFFFPEFLEELSRTFAVHALPQYAIRLADKLHSFYDACHVIVPEEKALSEARLALVEATKQVLHSTLDLMGVSAPEKM